MNWIDLKNCFICEQRDRTLYLTSLEIGADVIMTYGDDYKISKVLQFFEKGSESYISTSFLNSEFAEFVVANNTYVVLF